MNESRSIWCVVGSAFWSGMSSITSLPPSTKSEQMLIFSTGNSPAFSGRVSSRMLLLNTGSAT